MTLVKYSSLQVLVHSLLHLNLIKQELRVVSIRMFLVKAIIAGFFMFLPIMFMYIYGFCRIGFNAVLVNQYIASEMMPIMSICTTIAGFIIFFNICRPFTKFRAILFSCILAVVLLLLLAVPEFFLMNGTAYIKELMAQGGIGSGDHIYFLKYVLAINLQGFLT